MRILIVGAGDVGMRIVRRLRSGAAMGSSRTVLMALTRSPASRAAARAAGVVAVTGDLDRPRSLHRLAHLPLDAVMHLAPPPNHRASPSPHRDSRTRHLLRAMVPAHRRARGTGARKTRRGLRFVYVSTSGVYGDCAGDWVDESRPLRPTNGRAQRRVDAERVLMRTAKRNGWHATILRAPGIYDEQRLPLARVQAGTVAIVSEQDSYTNHIHSDDLAACCIAALRSKRTARVYHASDDSGLKMGDWFDRVADTFGLPRPPRVPRAEAQALVGPMLWSFMRESRRLSNARIKRELGMRLRYATVEAALAELPLRCE